MTLTATPRPTGTCRAELERFRPLNDANVESTDARRLALVGSLFPATRPDAALDDGRGALRLLAAMIVTP